MPRAGAGDADDLAKAFRSVRIEPAIDRGLGKAAKRVKLAAEGNLRSVSGSFSRQLTELSVVKQRSVELSGTLAMVAEYGTVGGGWKVPAGRTGRMKRVFGTGVAPPRAARGNRPRPEDGHVVGKAWRTLRNQLADEVVDQVWDEYAIQFDRKGIYKVGAGVTGG